MICLAPIALLLGSLAYGRPIRHRFAGTSLGWMLMALLVGVCNFSLSFARPILFRLRHGSMERYRFVSGIPGVGTLLVLVGGLLGFGSAPIALMGLAAMLIDTGGSFWFLLAIWKDSSLWDE
jgi:hypothetical protein